MSRSPLERVPNSLAARALQILSERNAVDNLTIINVTEDLVPSTGTKLFKFQAVQQEEPNGSHYVVVLDETGEVSDLAGISKREGKGFFAVPEIKVDMSALATAVGAITIDPTVNDLVLNLDDTLGEVITVTVPKSVGVSKADVYFLADTTGSMGSILASVQTGANAILTALNGLGLDLAFGVGNYKDFPIPTSNPYAFQHQLNLTTNAVDVTNAINTWVAADGSDGSEGQLFALDQIAEPPGGSIGWRTGSKRIIVWFGDAPGHDPICTAISGLAADITEASVTNKLVTEKITVLAISTVTGFPNGLDDDPITSANDYAAFCSIGGTSGQGTRIATATPNGTFISGIDATSIVDTIIKLIANAISTINNLKLLPTGGTVPFVTFISPLGGYGPLASDVEHVLPFDVVFTGVIPCSEKPQVFTGTIDAVADGVVVVSKQVKITIPACKRSYSVKFVCGVQEECKCDESVVRPGAYATEINIHNYQNKEVKIEKYLLPVVFAGAPSGREPKFVERKVRDQMVLPPNTATMDDCYRIGELLFGAPPSAPMPLTIGFLEIVSTEDLNVTVVYTVSEPKSGSISIDVEQIAGKLLEN